MKKMDDVTKMIEDYEKTVTLDKKELEKEKSEDKPKEEVKEETMFDILGEDKKKKKKRK